MKKLLYLLPVAALAMASCSNDDNAGIEQSVQQLATADQLMLRPAVGGASTRIAGFNSVQDLSEFHIDIAGAFKIGENGETVVNSITRELVNDDNFSLKSSDDKLYYWNDNTTKATFSAYAPSDIVWTETVKIPTERSQQKDYLVAYNEGYKSDFRSGVPMNFQHVTSQINVQATNKDFAKVNVAVKAIRFVNLRNEAALSLPSVSTVNGVFSWADYNPWSVNSSKTAEYLAENSTTVTLDANAKSLNFGDPQFLLPQQLTAATAPELDGENDWNESLTGHAIAFLIKVTNVNATVSGTTPEAEVDAIAAATTENPYTAYYVYPTAASLKAATNSDGYAWAYVPVDTKWEPGKKYIYTLNFAADAYGKVDPYQGEGGTQNPNEGEDNDQPGDDIQDVEVPLTFTVTVEDWIDVNEAKNL